MKANKEEIPGMYVALQKYINKDHKKECKSWEERVKAITNATKSVAGVACDVSVPPHANQTPLIQVTWDSNKVKLSQQEMMEKLRRGFLSIEVMPGAKDGINITVFMLKTGQEKIVAARLKEELIKESA
jgi:seryl-tRNA(Sec) selenium transferase